MSLNPKKEHKNEAEYKDNLIRILSSIALYKASEADNRKYSNWKEIIERNY